MATTPAGARVRKQLKGHVGLFNLPNQARLKALRNGFNLNIMVVGELGLGKSTFVNMLFDVDMFEPAGPFLNVPRQSTTEITSRTVDLHEKGVRLKLTVLDTPGFAVSVNNSDCWVPVLNTIESRLDGYLQRENRLRREAPVDDRVHVCLYFIQPTGHSLKQLDIEIMRKLHAKVNLIPIIAKADTLTMEEVERFKIRILSDLAYHGIEIYQPATRGTMQDVYEDEESIMEAQAIVDRIPFAVIGSRDVLRRSGERARVYPWGVVEVENEDHCDTVKLRQLLVRNHMEDLRDRTGEMYERWRTARMLEAGVAQDNSVFSEYDPAKLAYEEREALRLKLEKMEADMVLVFRNKVQEREDKLRRSEQELHARHREMRNTLDAQLRDLEERKRQLESESVGPDKDRRKKGFMRG